jgi:hypothetical protein
MQLHQPFSPPSLGELIVVRQLNSTNDALDGAQSERWKCAGAVEMPWGDGNALERLKTDSPLAARFQKV